MKRLAIFAILLSTPAFAQQPPQTPQDTIAIQNQMIGQLYIQIGTLQQQLSRANSSITDLNVQVEKLKNPPATEAK